MASILPSPDRVDPTIILHESDDGLDSEEYFPTTRKRPAAFKTKSTQTAIKCDASPMTLQDAIAATAGQSDMPFELKQKLIEVHH